MCIQGPPTQDGTVEIAYFTYPEFARRGYATEMASKLIALHAGRGGAASDRSHVAAAKCIDPRAARVGMTCMGEVVDPEDGNVWRWQLRVSRPSMTSTRVFRPGTACLVALLVTLPACLLADIYRWDTGAVIPGTAGMCQGQASI